MPAEAAAGEIANHEFGLYPRAERPNEGDVGDPEQFGAVPVNRLSTGISGRFAYGPGPAGGVLSTDGYREGPCFHPPLDHGAGDLLTASAQREPPEPCRPRKPHS